MAKWTGKQTAGDLHEEAPTDWRQTMLKRFFWVAFFVVIVATFLPDVIKYHPAQIAADVLKMPACTSAGWGDETCWNEARGN